MYDRFKKIMLYVTIHIPIVIATMISMEYIY